jgi:hypothetical protein
MLVSHPVVISLEKISEVLGKGVCWSERLCVCIVRGIGVRPQEVLGQLLKTLTEAILRSCQLGL